MVRGEGSDIQTRVLLLRTPNPGQMYPMAVASSLCADFLLGGKLTYLRSRPNHEARPLSALGAI